MNIREKLARLDSARPAQPPAAEPARFSEGAESWIETLRYELGLTVLQEDRSFILLKENYYPAYNDPVFAELQANGFEVPALRQISGDLPVDSPNLKRALFLDAETTGLAGGTGTYAFLVGIGHLEADHIVVRQYLLPDFIYEWLMLKHLDQALRQFDFTVTFNGKSFDIPLLKNRYILNRMVSALEEMPHADMLHAARRIWRRRLPACDLQTLEAHILNIDRAGDIPGDAIPHIYFEFIRKRDTLLLRDVLEHNFHDVAHMALLTLRICAICQAPGRHLAYPQDYYCLASYFFQAKRYREAIPLLEALLGRLSPGDAELVTGTLFLLSLSHKKTGDSARAKQYLENLLERRVFHPGIIEELAKFYEHEDKDYAGAGEIVEKGLQYLETVRQLDPRSELLRFLPGLKHRYQRLRRKLARKE